MKRQRGSVGAAVADRAPPTRSGSAVPQSGIPAIFTSAAESAAIAADKGNAGRRRTSEKPGGQRIDLTTWLFGGLVVGALLWGWSQRDEYRWSAESGIGYAFGIIGGSLMLLLLLYPVRKHWKAMRRLLPIRHWFRMHMLFGVVGPVLVLFHANFQLGSLNSRVALFSMLLVAGSGLVGRYVYRQIHRGLYGERIRFDELHTDYARSKARFVGNSLVDAAMASRLESIEQKLDSPHPTLWNSLRTARQIRGLDRRVRRRLHAALEKGTVAADQAAELRQAFAHWSVGLGSLSRMARNALFACMFSLWHVLHLPIFVMMLIAALAHVVVVHQY